MVSRIIASRPFLITRRSLMLAAAGLTFAPQALATEAGFSFLVVGDWGQPEPAQRQVANAMGRVATSLSSSFVISTGDNFYDQGVQSVEDPLWQTTYEQVYTAPSLQIPWFAVLGNHDHRGSAAAQVAYTATSDRWRMRARYWREVMHLPAGETVSFFFLDTNPIAKLPHAMIQFLGDAAGAHAQLNWLERELAACRSNWKIVIGHHPIMSNGWHGGTPAMVQLVRPLLEHYGVRAYFNGHDHDLEHISAGPVDYISSGAGAEARPPQANQDSRFAYGRQGFASCTLSRDQLLVRFHDADGAQVYSAVIPRAASAGA